jgi:hypothetical protein
MSTEEELKWMTKRYSWRYIPFRYQAMVATVVSGFLYFKIFTAIFRSENGAGGACGSLLRPVTEDGDVNWFSFDLFARNDELNCSRYMQVRAWELVASFAALAICGLVMRRAIRREEGIPSKGWNEWK